MRFIATFALFLSLASLVLGGYLMYREDRKVELLHQMQSGYEESLHGIRETSTELNSAIEISTERLKLISESFKERQASITKRQAAQEALIRDILGRSDNQVVSIEQLKSKVTELENVQKGKDSDLDVVLQSVYQQIRFLIQWSNVAWTIQKDMHKSLEAMAMAGVVARNLPPAQYELIQNALEMDTIGLKAQSQSINKAAHIAKLQTMEQHIHTMMMSLAVNPSPSKLMVKAQASHPDWLQAFLALINDSFAIYREDRIEKVSWSKEKVHLLSTILKWHVFQATHAVNNENQDDYHAAMLDIQNLVQENLVGQSQMADSLIPMIHEHALSGVKVDRTTLKQTRQALDSLQVSLRGF